MDFSIPIFLSIHFIETAPGAKNNVTILYFAYFAKIQIANAIFIQCFTVYLRVHESFQVSNIHVCEI